MLADRLAKALSSSSDLHLVETEFLPVINFHTEQPATQDVFPGGSHEKVAGAMHRYISSTGSSKVIGLDGEFGSGKSTILNMLGGKLKDSDPKCRVWFFDCEQNYQGSIKSNFIELFTDVLLKDVRSEASARDLRTARDKALGRLFTYRKKTTSRVSAWALALLTSLFFSANSFREIFALSRGAESAEALLLWVHSISFLSPGLVLLGAQLAHRKMKEGDQKWSLLSLFKGSSDDYINEKIEVAKEVTPLDLKRTLNDQLLVVSEYQYVVILDNLDRLPKDSLRAVWSDLEIFTSVASAANLTVIVPFCSTKVATYLKADGDRQYDAKDFIAKKFPIVFRAPPVIASGWKGGFRHLWMYSFQGEYLDVVEHCASLLQRHTPMLNSLVTPRLQKKFINDIATTSLVVGDQTSLLSIAAYLLLCKYNDYPLDEIFRVNGFSLEYEQQIGKSAAASVADTKRLLASIVGEGTEDGWQIEFLQIHFLTSSDIAIAELLDGPLAEAIAANDSEKFIALTSLFGFGDAFRRLVAKRQPLTAFLPTIHIAHAKSGGEWIANVLSALNVAKLPIANDEHPSTPAFYDAAKYCIRLGLDSSLLKPFGNKLEKFVFEGLDSPFDAEKINELRESLSELDMYLNALDLACEPHALDNAECFMHLLPVMSEFQVIRPINFSLTKAGLHSANRQMASCEAQTFDVTPLPLSTVPSALVWAYGRRKLGTGIFGGLSTAEVAILITACGNDSENVSAVLGLALAEKIDAATVAAVQSLLAVADTPFVRAVAAIVLIRHGAAASFAQIEDLEETLKSELFQALGYATLTSKLLLAIFDTEEGGAEIVPYLADMIKNDKISHLEHGWVIRNFSALMDSVVDSEFAAEDLLHWLNGWDVRLEPAGKKVVEADLKFVDMVFQPNAVIFPVFKNTALTHMNSVERTEEEWSAVLQQASPQHVSILRYIAAQKIPMDNSANITGAIIKLFNDVGSATTGVVLNNPQLAIIDVLMETLDAQQKSTIGIRLRPLLFDESVEPKNLAKILARYGKLIPDLQPSNSGDIGRIVLFLQFAYDHPAIANDLVAFFNSRAEQIANFKYSKPLRDAMGGAVKQLSERAPDLYKRFAETRGFIGFFKR